MNRGRQWLFVHRQLQTGNDFLRQAERQGKIEPPSCFHFAIPDNTCLSVGPSSRRVLLGESQCLGIGFGESRKGRNSKRVRSFHTPCSYTKKNEREKSQ